MANTTYQVTLSTDGAHTVTITSDEPAAMKTAVAWASATHTALVERYGHAPPAPDHTTTAGDGDETEQGEAPVCAVHAVPMVRMQGKRGPFWSCHARMDDSSFCAYRPPVV